MAADLELSSNQYSVCLVVFFHHIYVSRATCEKILYADSVDQCLRGAEQHDPCKDPPFSLPAGDHGCVGRFDMLYGCGTTLPPSARPENIR